MEILSGKKISKIKREVLKNKITPYLEEGYRAPKLVVILVGNDPSSEIYVKNKAKASREVGIDSEIIKLPSTVTDLELTGLIKRINKAESVDALLLQLPLPKHLNEEKFIQLIDPKKDVDGFHYQNQGKLMENIDTIYPCTPLGVVSLLDAYKIDVTGMNVCMVGTSNIVGKPLGMMLLNKGATVDFCNINTFDIKKHTKRADIVISATGKQFVITKDMIKKGTIVIDVGTIRDPKTNKLVGDVDFNNVKNKTSYITPVPGGVGPMTIVSLMENTFKLYLNNIIK